MGMKMPRVPRRIFTVHGGAIGWSEPSSWRKTVKPNAYFVTSQARLQMRKTL